jgi:TfoX/Sxy family transcriptional regulator of competence genes
MPAFEKSPAALVERFDYVAMRRPDAQRRTMFGYPALFVRGNMATGLFADRWVVRLSQEDADNLLALPGAEPFVPMPGRSMRGWAMLSRDMVDDDQALDAWLARAFAFAASLPAKA